MKTVYFIRHGQSEGNAGLLRQVATTGLTEKGRNQSKEIADRISKISPEILISSTMTRAVETTQIITAQSNLPVEYSALFIERRRPSVQLGVAKNDPMALQAEKTIREKFAEKEFRYSDEENFADLKDRAIKALAYLADRREETIVVITHGFFMRIIVACAVFGANLTGAECQQFIRKFRMENAGFTILNYGSDTTQNPYDWDVSVWNDHTYLD